MELDLNLLLVQLAVIFLPGIIWERLDARFAAKIKPSTWESLVRTLSFGLVVYTVEFMIYSLLNLHFTTADLTNAKAENVITKPVIFEIACALPLSLGLAIVWL